MASIVQRDSAFRVFVRIKGEVAGFVDTAFRFR